MTKLQEVSPSFSCVALQYLSRCSVALVATVFCLSPVHVTAATNTCTAATQAEVDAVFNQAVSTVSSLSNAAVRASTRGTWRPEGTFRRVFFAQSGRALRTIRSLLGAPEQKSQSCISSQNSSCASNTLPKTELLEAFDQIFSIPFPKGLRSLRRLQKVERDKFASAIEALPDNYITCG